MRDKKALTRLVAELLAVMLTTVGLTGCDYLGNNGGSSQGTGAIQRATEGSSVGTEEADDAGKNNGYKPLTNAEAQYARQFSGGANQFGLDLFAAAAERQGQGENLLLSTYSVYSALVMLSHGMQEDSSVREELLKEMYLTDAAGSVYGHDITVDANVLLNRALEENQYATVSIANSFWVSDAAVPAANHDAFMERINAYGADYYQLNLSSQEAVEQINEWADAQTNHMIPRLVSEPFPIDTMSVILNAVYFLGEWNEEFKESNTWKQTFYGTSGEQTVDMMHQTANLEYYSTEQYTCVRLPYKGGEYVMNVYLANAEDTNIAGLYQEGKLTGEQLSWIFGTDARSEAAIQWSRGEVSLSLPKFELENRVELKEAVQMCGIEKLFDNADLKEVLMDEIYVSDISQLAKIIVDERGTEAAAVTMIGTECESVQESPMVLSVDEPFLFTIEDRVTGTILFTGMIHNIEP